LKNSENDRLRNTRWHTYHIELDVNVKIMKRLHSIFSEPISNELVWSDIIATSFYEFFDINRYIASLEK
jgi:hypothetical protein